MRSQVTPLGLLKRMRQELPKLAPIIPEIPAFGLELLRKTKDRERSSHDYVEELRQLNAEIRHRHQQLVGTIVACAALLTGIVLIIHGTSSLPHIDFIEIEILGIILAIFGLLLLILYRPGKKKRKKSLNRLAS